MASGFFSMLLRMKYIDRWSLMRNTPVSYTHLDVYKRQAGENS